MQLRFVFLALREVCRHLCIFSTDFQRMVETVNTSPCVQQFLAAIKIKDISDAVRQYVKNRFSA